jgi:streptogramin lyase
LKLAKPLSLLLALLALVFATFRVDTAEAIITEFSTGLTPGSKPMGLVAGPDGNVWFTHYGSEGVGPAVGRITPAGVITEFRAGLDGGFPQSLVVGPDGNLWFGIGSSKTSGPAIGKITPEGEITRVAELTSKTDPDDLTVGPGGRIWWVSNSGSRPGVGYVQPGGVILQVHLPTWPTDIVAGPDGNMWFTYGEGSVAAIARIDSPEDPGDTTITYFRDGLREESDPREIVLGPDGNLWFTDPWIDAIGKVTPDGSITQFDAPNLFGDSPLVPGPDGNIWFTDWGLNRIAPSGEIKWFGTPGNGESRNPEDLAFGPGDDLWFTSSRFEDPGNGAVGRMTSHGEVYEYNVGINPGSWPREIVLGPDGSFWFADWGETSAVGRVTPEGNRYVPPWYVEPEAPPNASPPPPFPRIPQVGLASKRIAVSRTGIAKIRLNCFGSLTCTGILRALAKKRAWRADRVLGAVPFTIAGGSSTFLTLRINRAGRALLREAGGHRQTRLTVVPKGPLVMSNFWVELVARS